MREIKFRAWYKPINSGGFDMYHWEVLDNVLNDVWVAIDAQKFKNPNPVLMQYTGLKDRHGIEIYEWDIVNGKDNEGEYQNRVVTFAFGGFEPFTHWQDDCRMDENNCEVIGNIYENPELLDK